MSVRHEIAKTLQELRDNGFYPERIENGRILWMVALMGEAYANLLEDLKDNPVIDIEEEKAKARGSFREIGSVE